ncbi:glycosyltransferase family 4 protein [Aquirufa sp. ROCK-SH2]
MTNKILFFVNNLNRTGSETLILNLINDLNQQNNLEIGIVLLKKGGELVPEIAPNIPVFYLDLEFTLLDKLLFHAGIDVIGNKIQKIQDQFTANMWYFNTIDHVSLLKYKNRFNCQAFVHVHELIYNFEAVKSDELFSIVNFADHLIACSELVKELFTPFFLQPITVVNSTIQLDKFLSFKQKKTKHSSNSVKVISSGTICHRKGADLFYEVARILQDKGYEFIWLGKPNQSAFGEIVRLKNEQTQSVQFLSTNSQKEYLEIFSKADVFFSTSREESMGLVMMEAIALEIPILALNSGGSTLIVDENNGKICHDVRPQVLADELMNVINNRANFTFEGGVKFDYHTELQKLASILH